MERRKTTRRPTTELLEGRILLSGNRGDGPRSGLPPIIRIVSPLADSVVAPGEGRVRAGSLNGTGFALNLEPAAERQPRAGRPEPVPAV